MNKNKIFNDPVYGFVSINFEIIYDLIQHPYFQRLRRISQLGMTQLTYPGAVHTRFHHALGALHLMNLSIEVLRQKGQEITNEEAEAASIAILLHDIGHGPFSHALEGKLIGINHEEISLRLLQLLNVQFDGRLTMAIAIFTNNYEKAFLHQLISSQLDLDRLDYLNRDSFYTGVMEGKIGYDRIIKMLRVVDGQLAVEEKGLASIEKFLVARKIMYWQVYLHKTVLAAEKMLIAGIERTSQLYLQGDQTLQIPEPLTRLFAMDWQRIADQKPILEAFVQMDDVDIMILLKNSASCSDYILHTISKGLIERILFRVELSDNPNFFKFENDLKAKLATALDVSDDVVDGLVWSGKETLDIYNEKIDQIKIYQKNGEVKNLSDIADFHFLNREISKFYLCYPRI